MDPVIVAYDGSPHAEDALAFAGYVAGLLASPLEVVCAYPVGGRAARSYDEVLRTTALETLAGARTRVPLDVRAAYSALPATSLGRALHEHAQEHTARLVVLGSSRHGAAHRVTTGTLAGRLLHGAPCPVAVVPAGWAQRATGAPSRIVCGYEHGPEGERALAAAEELARRAHLPLKLVTAAPTGFVAAAEWPMYTLPEVAGEDAAEVAHDHLEHAAADVDAVVDVHTETLVGDPARRLRDHAEADDLLVLGSRGYGPVRSVLLGSVSKGVVADSPCPVIVIPRAPGHGLGESMIASTAAAAGSA